MRNKKQTGLRVGIYARRTVDSEKSDSIKMQIDTCTAHLKLKYPAPGEIESITIYADEGFTRRNTDRPDWQRMMRDVDNHFLDLVCVYRIDRASGNMKDFSLFYSKLVDEKGVQLIAVREGIDSSLPLIGEVMAYIAAMMATYEVKQDSIRSYDNSRSLAVYGYWSGGRPPIGYTLIPVTENGKVHKVLEPVAEIVEYRNNLISIFLDNQLSLSGMERYLRKNGIKTQNGKFFSTNQIYTILTAPQCVANTQEMYDFFESKGCQMEQTRSARENWDGKHGIIIYGRTSEQKGKHIHNPQEKWLVCIGRHRPIMDAERYFQIIRQLQQNTFNKTSKHPPTLLKGILHCSCGSVMRISWKRKVDNTYGSWYFCLRQMRQGEEYCQRHFIKTEFLDNKVLDIFHKIQVDPNEIDKYMKKRENPKSKKSAASIRASIRNTQEQVNNLTAALAANSESTATKYIIKEIERLDAELISLQSDLLLAKSEEIRNEDDKMRAISKREEICRLVSDFDLFSPEERNKIAKDILKECVWDGETLHITL
ncbi:recombinase family protein [Clostridium sp. AN503]|uniref:recombinase family protein n=1 Tax=Clostridium sp. AN503 TaxID=3160598 RepID=UPI0034577F23